MQWTATFDQHHSGVSKVHTFTKHENDAGTIKLLLLQKTEVSIPT